MRYGRIARSRPRDEAVVPTSNFFQTSDGHWLFMNSRPGEPDWPEIMRATGLEHLADDPRFDSFRNRRKNGPALVAEFDAVFARYTLDEWQKRLDAEGIIWSPVQSFEQALEDPQMHAAGVFVDMPKATAQAILHRPRPFGLAMKAPTRKAVAGNRRAYGRNSGNAWFRCRCARAKFIEAKIVKSTKPFPQCG